MEEVEIRLDDNETGIILTVRTVIQERIIN